MRFLRHWRVEFHALRIIRRSIAPDVPVNYLSHGQDFIMKTVKLLPNSFRFRDPRGRTPMIFL